MRVKSGKPAAPRRKGQKMKKVLKFLCSRVVIVTLAILVQFCFLLFIVLTLLLSCLCLFFLYGTRSISTL